MMRFTVELTPESIAALAKVDRTGIRLEHEIDAAMDATEQDMLTEIPYQQHWTNSSGALEGSFDSVPTYNFTKNTSTNIREIGSDLPYARRREFGFSGMEDSLGRLYAVDPGGFYMDRSVEYIGPIFRDNIEAAVERAMTP